MSYFLRTVRDYDAKLLYKWANDPDTRAASFKQDEIKWEEHVKWLKDLLADEDRDIFICMDFLSPIGVVRTAKDEKDEKKGIISYQVSPDMRGRGIGVKMLRLLEAKEKEKYTVLRGEVKPDNEHSINIFKKLGYEQVSADEEKLVFEKDISKEPEKQSYDRPYREPQFEIMRVVAMLMVIALHYQIMGGRLSKAPAGLGFIDWLVEALCIVSVNLYVMISGYFLTEKSFSVRKCIRLWAQVFFYSVFIWVFMMIVGAAGVNEYFSFKDGIYINVYDIQAMLFPVINRHYWYATVYIVFYIFSPLLAAGVNRLKERQLKWMLILLIALLSIPKSLLPVEFPIDDYGYSVTWFIVLFMIANYIRRFGIPFFEKKSRALIVYFLSALMIVAAEGLAIAIRGPQPDRYYYATPIHYNFIFVITGSVALFCFFKNLKIKNTDLTSFLVWIAPYTFGVYLLHTHRLVMDKWPIWLWLGGDYGALRPFHMIFCVMLIFCIGIFIDIMRNRLFILLERFLDWCMSFYYSKKEVFDYLITGFLTTVICWVAYAIFDDIIFKNMEELLRVNLSDAISWFIAFVFAYVVNRSFVFHSDKHGFKDITKEFIAFGGARISTLIIELVLLNILVGFMHVNEKLSKYLICSIVVIILNYIFSKLFVFKKKDQTADEKD
ncbi:MAG: GNAT family N-acetyltransferase [Lachnospiraceae bacterium]|nr:GNAT family N-acetyltransferase [Lachnospiraceae bacterium]